MFPDIPAHQEEEAVEVSSRDCCWVGNSPDCLHLAILNIHAQFAPNLSRKGAKQEEVIAVLVAMSTELTSGHIQQVFVLQIGAAIQTLQDH